MHNSSPLAASSRRGSFPTLQFEKNLWKDGFNRIAGIDEAGRGALAGPVAAAAVILPPDLSLLESLRGSTGFKTDDP